MRIVPLAVMGALLALTPIVHGATAPADVDYSAFTALCEKRPPAGPQEMGSVAFFTWIDRQLRSVTEAGIAFYRAHPEDARRWDVVLSVTRESPLFATSFGPDVDEKGFAAAVVDETARTAWVRQAETLWAELLAASDSTPAQKHEASFTRFAFYSRSLRAELASGARQDARAAWEELVARFDEHVARFAGNPALSQNAADFIQAWKKLVPGSEQTQWQRLTKSADPQLREFAQRQLKMAEGEPLDFSFAAADGRAVDLKQLRGKVVLIDFWATWCGPCIAELPNVRSVYAKYRDQGFEVVGITLENAGIRPTDNSEQIAAKLAAAKQKLLSFVQEKEIPWPQHFDGQGWKNEFAAKFGVNGIPAMFLLDKTGRIATTEARGEKLEQEVRRLLGL